MHHIIQSFRRFHAINTWSGNKVVSSGEKSLADILDEIREIISRK